MTDNNIPSNQLDYYLGKLNESYSFFKESNKIAQFGSYVYDIKNNQWYCTEVLNEILGIDENYTKNLETFIQLVHPDFVEEFLSYLQNNVLKGHEVFNKEYMIINQKTKEPNWVIGLGELKFGTDGNPEFMIGSIQNINKRKVAEAEIVKERNEVKQYLDIAGVMLAVLDPEMNITKINQKGCEILGYTEEELIGKNWLENFIPDNIKEKINAVANAILEGNIKKYEYRENQIIAKDGSVKTIAFHNSLIRNDHGEITGIIFSGEDITEHILVEEELKNIFSLSPDMVCVADLENLSFRKINPAFRSILGYSKTEIAGKPFFDFIHPDDIEKTKAVIQESLLKGKKIQSFENRYRAKDGSYRWLEWFSHPIPEKGIAYEIARDITKRKIAENKLKESEKRFKFAINNSNITVSNQDKELKYTWYYNPHLGISVDDIIGKKDEDIYTVNDAEKITKLKQKVFETGESIYTIVQLIINGKRTHNQLSIEPVFDEEENVVGISTMSADVTDLENAKQKALESDKLKSAFLTNLSHEIRTPMNGIVGFSQLMNEPNTSEDKRTQYAKIINESGKQLLNIINDIIDISKIESGQIDIKLHNVSMNEMLYELLSFYKPILNKKEVDIFLIKGFSDSESVIITDGTKLQQIINNLISNASKFTSQGYIEFGYYLKGGFVEFYVKDTGIGIMPEFQEKIFDRFSQEKSTWEQKQAGTGLGLSISKAYVELMGGKIWLKSRHGSGTTFYFTIPYEPVKEPVPESPKAVDSPREVDLSGKTILIAEDNDMNYLLLEEFLITSKAKLIRAKNGQEAVDYCKKVPKIDIILMDIKMPVLDGYGAIKQIKAFKPEIPIIAQSAFAMLEDEKKALDTGSDDYISKPIKGSLLISKIRKLLK